MKIPQKTSAGLPHVNFSSTNLHPPLQNGEKKMHFLKKIIGIQIKNLIYFNFLDMFSIKII